MGAGLIHADRNRAQDRNKNGERLYRAPIGFFLKNQAQADSVELFIKRAQRGLYQCLSFEPSSVPRVLLPQNSMHVIKRPPLRVSTKTQPCRVIGVRLKSNDKKSLDQLQLGLCIATFLCQGAGWRRQNAP